MTTYNDQWAGIRRLQFRQFDPDNPGYLLPGGVWDVDDNALAAGGYNTKYKDRPEEVAPNVFRVTVQQPGAHKYDTADAFYAVDPTTGMGTLVEDPTATRQVSSREKWRDRLEKRILPIAGAVLTAGYGAEALAGMGAGGAGAGAAEAGAGALMDYGVGSAALDSAATGWGLTEGAGAAASGAGSAGAAGAAGGGGLLGAAAPSAAGGLLRGISPTLLQLGGAALGAASSQDQEQTTTTKNEPWSAAQPWIKDNIAAGQALQKRYTDQPFSPGQQAAYGNLYGLLNSFNTEMLPGLLGNANAMSQGYDRYAPKETRSKPKFGAVGSTWAPGLLKFGG